MGGVHRRFSAHAHFRQVRICRLKSAYTDLSPHMQTYLSLRNDACVYVYMSAYADLCQHMQTSHADLCMSDREIILLRLARHTDAC